MSADTIARLKITLDDVRSAVLRRIEVPFNIRLDRLHCALPLGSRCLHRPLNLAPCCPFPPL